MKPVETMRDGEAGEDGSLPTHGLGAAEFEDFTERLLRAHQFSSVTPHVIRVERWGRPGDKQDGIDFAGRWSDGRDAAWQCKAYRRFSPAQVHAAVTDCTFVADRYFLVLSCVASSRVRAAVREHPGWELLDRHDLAGFLKELPLHQQRDVLDDTWGSAVRKRYLRVPGEDVFQSLHLFRSMRLDQRLPLNDSASFQGRGAELDRLTAALDRASGSPPVVVLNGAGGRGKTRLAIEGLTRYGEAHLAVPIICLAGGRLPSDASLVEIPAGPCSVLIDDAHRDAVELPALLAAARGNPEMQLVLTARDNGIDRVRATVLEAGFPEQQLVQIELTELTRPQSRRLVRELTDGLQFVPALKAYLEDQAVHSPHIAVITANLARNGELTGSLSLSPGLRHQVLARYRDVLIGDTGHDGRVVGQFLAVVAALGDVAVDDAEEWDRVAAFCGASLRDILTLRASLRGRGVIRETQGAVRVVPELLAEQVLEAEAVIDGADSGFVRRLWSRFGGTGRTDLAITIAELDWRLVQHGLPSVVEHVWSALAQDVSTASTADLVRLLPKLAPLARTQPGRLIDLLDEMRNRARQLDDESATQQVPDLQATRNSDAVDDLETLVRRMTGQPPLSATDVDRAVAAAYGQCAVTDANLLERVLDVLWRLGNEDPRPPAQNPTHAHCVLKERFLTLGELPSAEIPRRVIAWVRAQLSSGTVYVGGPEAASLLRLLAPLVEKAGARTEMASFRSLRFVPFTVDLAWARPVRGGIRALLRDAGTRDLRTDATIVDLLAAALRPPIGHFGAEISTDEVLKWGDDDLETLQDLAALAEKTESAVLRRHIRSQLGWTAEFSQFADLRARAFRLLWELDQRDDELEDLLLNETLSGPSPQRGQQLPDPRSFPAAIEAERRSDDAQRAADVQERVDRHIREVEERSARRVSDLVARLSTSGTVSDALNRVQAAAVEVIALGTRQAPFLWDLARGVGQQDDDCVAAVLTALQHRGPSVLDGAIGAMLSIWAGRSPNAFLDWTSQYDSFRPGVRVAIAQVLAGDGWASADARLTELRSAGLADDDDEVREAFLRAEHPGMTERPAQTIALLESLNASVSTCRFVLQAAAKANPAGWGAGLGDTDAAAVLRFLGPIDWSDWIASQVLVGIAASHPRRTLEHLTAQAAAGHSLPLNVEGLTTAFDHHEVADWLIHAIVDGVWVHEAEVIGVIASDGMSKELAATLQGVIDSLGPTQIVALPQALAEIPMWTSDGLPLAEAIVRRAIELGVSDGVIDVLRRGAHLRHWSASNGISPELEAAHASVAVAAEATSDPQLQTLFAALLGEIDAHRRQVERRDDEDDDDDE